MMKSKNKYSCRNCAQEYTKWFGQCKECKQWNTIEEIKIVDIAKASQKLRPSSAITLDFKEITNITPIKRNSLFVIGGEPGIGKSTLIAQLCLRMDASRVLYCAGEEAVDSVQERIKRVATNADTYVNVVYETYIDKIRMLINEHVDLIIIDSMHTLRATIPTSIANICDILREIAIEHNVAIILTSHITKEGVIAGPKSIEHMVDVVFYLEGDRYGQLRTLRSIKNRFGSTSESSMFEMTPTGLIAVNSQNRFVAERSGKMCGSLLSAINVNGQLVIIEIQSLVVKDNIPRTDVCGYSASRVRMLVNVIIKLCNITNLSYCCICVSIASGIKSDDGNIELAICAAIISSYFNLYIPANIVFCGEVSLTGDIVEYNIKRLANIDSQYILVGNFATQHRIKNIKQLLAFLNTFKSS